MTQTIEEVRDNLQKFLSTGKYLCYGFHSVGITGTKALAQSNYKAPKRFQNRTIDEIAQKCIIVLGAKELPEDLMLPTRQEGHDIYYFIFGYPQAFATAYLKEVK